MNQESNTQTIESLQTEVRFLYNALMRIQQIAVGGSSEYNLAAAACSACSLSIKISD